MDYFEEARLKAFNFIKSFESVKKLTADQLIYYKFERFVEVWKVKLDFYNNENNILEYEINVCFKLDFPLSIPSIYLSPTSYEKLKYIPHIDTNRLICTFDSEITKTDVSQPSNIVLECINRVKKIIDEGVKKENFEDFEDEFLSYWECNYSKNDSVRNDFLCLIDPNEIIETPSLLNLKTAFGSYNYIIHNNNKLSDKLKINLRQKKINFSEQSIFYFEFEKKNFIPPFDLDNEEVLKLLNSINKSLVSQYELYINKKSTEIGLVIANYKTNKKNILIGWVNKHLELSKKKGFRSNVIKPFEAISIYQKKDKIIRILPEIYTKKRLNKRTSGLNEQPEYKFLISGIGSVGSHLINLLNSLNNPEFILVDNDYLKIENIGRHLLGVNSIKKYKTKAMKDYLNELNPMQEVKTFEKSIIDVAQNNISFLNDSDYIFVATGKDNVDHWIVNSLKKGAITKPIFIIWVEPYLSGGHMIYLNPRKLLDYNSLFQNNFYKYNVINNTYYNSPENTIALKEAGCQTTYIPYSSQNLMLFLAAIFPIITSIVTNSKIDSKVFTWIGDLDFLAANKIDLSDFVNKKTFGNIIETYD